MPDLADGESTTMKGSGASPYTLKNSGGVYSCTCPAWRNQSLPPDRRTCKHLRKLRGDAAEQARLQSEVALKPMKPEGAEEVEKLPVLLAHVWTDEYDPAGWWMSEKLDGVRAYWDGKQFLSRNNNIFYAPKWFTEGFPTHPLDGELWIARKAFDRTSGLVRQQSMSDEWKHMKYLIFDAPEAGGAFEERLQVVAAGVKRWASPYALAHEHVVCKGLDHMLAELDRVNKLGGEGLMLRKPGSAYERTRSTSLLKVKTFLDAEATVIGYEAGAGRHKGRVGALVARFGNGKEFKIGTGLKDRERESPPPVGSVVNVKYQELTKDGIPRFPVFVGLRPDARPSAAPPTRQKDPAPVPKSVPISVPTGGATMAATTKRYFECVEDGASKFWEVWMDGNTVTTNWGKIGTAGQTKPKEFADDAKAKKEYDKLVAEKTGKGYVEKPRP